MYLDHIFKTSSVNSSNINLAEYVPNIASIIHVHVVLYLILPSVPTRVLKVPVEVVASTIFREFNFSS